jgi:hypothetical protein
MKAASKSHAGNKTLSTDQRNAMPDSSYAFPEKRKEPLNNASHVRNAIARFDQVKGVSDSERDHAFANIKAAAKRYGVEMTESHWSELGKKPHTSESTSKHRSH